MREELLRDADTGCVVSINEECCDWVASRDRRRLPHSKMYYSPLHLNQLI